MYSQFSLVRFSSVALTVTRHRSISNLFHRIKLRKPAAVGIAKLNPEGREASPSARSGSRWAKWKRTDDLVEWVLLRAKHCAMEARRSCERSEGEKRRRS